MELRVPFISSHDCGNGMEELCDERVYIFASGQVGSGEVDQTAMRSVAEGARYCENSARFYRHMCEDRIESVADMELAGPVPPDWSMVDDGWESVPRVASQDRGQRQHCAGCHVAQPAHVHAQSDGDRSEWAWAERPPQRHGGGLAAGADLE